MREQETKLPALWRWARQGLVALVAWNLMGFAQAQDAAPQAKPQPPEARCLVKPTKPLKYPDRAKEFRDSGILRAKLTFKNPDQAPKVTILAWSGSHDMVEAAEDYLWGYRLPCLQEGRTVELEQEVVFNALAVEGDSTVSRSSVWDCLRTPDPFYYTMDMQTGTHFAQKARSNVLFELAFEAPDKPPKIKVIYNSAPRSFRDAAEANVKDYRLPCMKPADPPQIMHWVYRFSTSNEGIGSGSGNDLALKDLGLATFMRAVKDVDKVHVKFDLDTMACPFQVKFRAYQPVIANGVSEVGDRVPTRKPFLEWLESLSMSLNKGQFESLMGAQMVIDVPCGTIEL